MKRSGSILRYSGRVASVPHATPGAVIDGKMEHKIEDGVVTQFGIVTDKVTDIAPIRVFNALRVLDCSGTHTPDWRANSRLADLTPLKGMNLTGLTHLRLRWTKVDDAGMAYFKDSKNLVNLLLTGTQVGDTGLALQRGFSR